MQCDPNGKSVNALVDECGCPVATPNERSDWPSRLGTALLFAQTDSVIVQAVRFAVVGAIATVADVSVLYVLTSIIGFPYWLSAAFGYALGITVSYPLSVRWVFASRTLSNRVAEFVAFGAIGVAGLGLTELVMCICVELLSFHYMLAKAVAIVTVFAWNFGARRALLFRRTNAPAETRRLDVD